MAYDLKSRFDKISPVASSGKTGISLALDWLRKDMPGGTPMTLPGNDGESKPLQNELGTSPGARKDDTVKRLLKALAITVGAGALGGQAGVQTAGAIGGMIGADREARMKQAREAAKMQSEESYRADRNKIDLERLDVQRDKLNKAKAAAGDPGEMNYPGYKSRVNTGAMFPDPDPIKEAKAMAELELLQKKGVTQDALAEKYRKGGAGGKGSGGGKSPKEKSASASERESRAEFNRQLPRFINALVAEADKNDTVPSSKIVDQKIERALSQGDDAAASLLDYNRDKIIKRIEEKRRKVPVTEAEKPQGWFNSLWNKKGQ